MGRISRCSALGINVRTDFFDNIFVEAEELPDGCFYDFNVDQWIWQNGEDQMHWDIHETVRLTVIGEEWNDQTPTKPSASPDEEAPVEEVRPAAYIIKGSMKAEGLGVTMWWDY